MQLHADELRQEGVEILAVSRDTPEESRAIAEKRGFEFALLSDPDLTAVDAFGVRHAGAGMGGEDLARPATFLIDEQGVIRWTELTENWRVRLRPERVFEALKTLG